MGTALRIFLLLPFFLPAAFCAADSVLTISGGGRTVTYKAADLLKRDDLEPVVVAADPSYPGGARRYRAVKLARLFGGLPVRDDGVLQFRALDGFSAPISRERALNSSEEKGAVAYVAVEDPAAPWPPLAGKSQSAGPFYLIWKNPERSRIGPEEWPYQLSGFEVKGSLHTVYPGLFPFEKGGRADVKRGFGLFQKHCFSCHTLNNCGSSQLGPDLNVPMNPFEYLQEPALRKLIRDPRSVRKWPHSLMTGFNATVLPDSDLEAILVYLKHMKGRKSESCAASAGPG